MPIVGKEVLQLNKIKAALNKHIQKIKDTPKKKEHKLIIIAKFDSTMSCPIHGIALIRFVITVAPQSDICP